MSASDAASSSSPHTLCHSDRSPRVLEPTQPWRAFNAEAGTQCCGVYTSSPCTFAPRLERAASRHGTSDISLAGRSNKDRPWVGHIDRGVDTSETSICAARPAAQSVVSRVPAPASSAVTAATPALCGHGSELTLQRRVRWSICLSPNGGCAASHAAKSCARSAGLAACSADNVTGTPTPSIASNAWRDHSNVRAEPIGRLAQATCSSTARKAGPRLARRKSAASRVGLARATSSLATATPVALSKPSAAGGDGRASSCAFGSCASARAAITPRTGAHALPSLRQYQRSCSSAPSSAPPTAPRTYMRMLVASLRTYLLATTARRSTRLSSTLVCVWIRLLA